MSSVKPAKTVLIFIIAYFLAGVSAIGCEDIALLSDDARYMILDGGTLNIKDVGNLWWLGLRDAQIYSHSHSTLQDAVLYTQGSDYFFRHSERPPGQYGAILVLQDLGRSLVPDVELPFIKEGDTDHIQWIYGSKNLLHSRLRESSSKGTYEIRLLNPRLQPLATWESKSVGGYFFCASNSNVILGGPDYRIVLSPSTSNLTREPLAQPRAFSGQRFTLTYISQGCRGVMVHVEKSETSSKSLQVKRPMALVDISDNRILSTFRAKRNVDRLLFRDATRLLEQDQSVIPDKYGDGVYLRPLDHFQIRDTHSGTVLQERNLGFKGKLSRLFCEGGQEKVVLSGKNMIKLVDLKTLTIIASKAIPFDRYSVF